MDIVSALMRENNIRLSCGDKWLIFDCGEWVVYQRKHGARKTEIICRTAIQDIAVDSLLS